VGRPYSKIGATELRYGENVTRYGMEVMDGIDEVEEKHLRVGEGRIGWDKKLANHMFSIHYEGSPMMAIAISTVLRLLIFVSGFAYATPFWVILILIAVLSQSSSAALFIAKIYEEGDIMTGFRGAVKLLVMGLPFSGNTQALQAVGVIAAGNDFYAFGGTYKERRNEEGGGGALAKIRYDEVPVKWGITNYVAGGTVSLIFLITMVSTEGFSGTGLVLYLVFDLL
jgi:predicted DNA-binding ribbon-helix-helix protein